MIPIGMRLSPSTVLSGGYSRGLYRPRINVTNPINWAHPLNKGRVAWWLAPIESGHWGGNTLRDLCNRSHGAFVDRPTWVPGPDKFVGVSFDGVNDYAQLSSLPFTLPQFTYLADVAILRNSDQDDAAVITVGKIGGTAGGYPAYLTAGNSRVSFYSQNAGSTWRNGGTALSLGTRYMMGWSYDGSTQTVWLNGKSDGSWGGGSALDYSTTNGAYISRRVDGLTAGQFSNIRLYSLTVFNRALLPSEVALIYHLSRHNYITRDSPLNFIPRM